MNKTDQLNLIEAELKIRLPEDYRKTMLEFPLQEDGTEPLLYEDLEQVLRVNRKFKKSGFRGEALPPSVFVVGGNRAGDVYFIDTERENSPVFAVTSEMESFDVDDLERFRHGFTFSTWVGELMSGQDWYREVQRSRKKKKWWQFWI